MRRTFAFLTTLLACFVAGQTIHGQQYLNVPGNAGYAVDGRYSVQPVAYQTYLGDSATADETTEMPIEPKIRSTAGKPVAYSAGASFSCDTPSTCSVRGCTGCSSCTARGCTAPVRRPAPTCAAPTCAAPTCAAPTCAAPTCAAPGGCTARSRGCTDRGCGCSMCRNDRMSGRAFGSLEYMFWWSDARQMPVLVTTSVAGTPQATAGVLPGAGVLFGGDSIGGSNQAGGRITAGLWLNDCENLAVVGRLYSAEGEDQGRSFSSTDFPILARPFFNDDPLVNAQDALLVGFPGLNAGTIGIQATNDVFGVEGYLKTLIDCDACYRVDLLMGMQYNRIDDELNISSNIVAGGTTFALRDSFDAENDFYAGTIGVLGEYTQGAFTLTSMAKIATGSMRQSVTINGSNTITVGGGAPVTTSGGFLAQPVANIGTFTRDTIAVAPEAGLNLNIAMTESVDFTVGYSFIYWN